VSGASFSQRLDEDAKLLQTSISTDTHANDTETETIISYTHTDEVHATYAPRNDTKYIIIFLQKMAGRQLSKNVIRTLNSARKLNRFYGAEKQSSGHQC